VRYFIDNKIAFTGAIVAFVGSLFVTLDRFSYFQQRFSDVGQWKKMTIALQTLDGLKEKDSAGQPIGVIREKDEGFVELAHIIALNRPDLAQKRIIAIAKNKPVAIADVSIPVIHVVTNDAPSVAKSLTFEFALMQWISAYRTEWFLYRGFIFVSLGFLLGILSRIKKKKEEKPPNKAPEPTPPSVTPPADAGVAPAGGVAHL
jgi:hypothetical protein